MKLVFEALIKFSIGFIFIGMLLFIPAGSFNYYNAWLLMGLLFILIFISGIFMMIKNKELLEKRLKVKEEQKEQKRVILLSCIMFIFGFIIAGLNYRFKFIILNDIVVIISSIIFVISYLLYGEVLRENTYLSRTIKVEKNQKVIDKGLYSIVRHPMYSVTILLFLTMPLILNSFISFLIFLTYPFIITKRIKNEEEVLEKELDGYSEYMKKVKYRLIPFIY